MTKVVFSSAADRDLEGIRQYMVSHSPHQALDYMDKLVEQCWTIAAGPLRYRLVASQAERGLRRRRFGPYLIFFIIRLDRIEIVRVLHEKMDYMRLIVFDV